MVPGGRPNGMEGQRQERGCNSHEDSMTSAEDGAGKSHFSSVPAGREVSYNVCGTIFKVDKAYQDLKPVGKGSYGIVCSALNVETKENVAIKRVSPISTHVIDAKHVLREIRMMRYLGTHENIITLKDLALRDADDELYIVMELLDSDLHRIIQSKQALSDAHFRFFMHQVLKGLKFLHDHRIIHRDLKPGNLLVTRACELRITDFGLARARPAGKGQNPDESIEEPMTEHVVTRWYRPPELMLCPDGLYDYAVDMWSVGCIFAELLGRKPLFPGKNFVHQLTLIFDVIGAPRPQEVAHVKSSQAKRFLDSVAAKKKVPFATLFPEASREALSLLNSLLVFEPAHRLTVDQALGHKYFEPLRHSVQLQQQQLAADAAQAARPPPKLDFDFETGHLNKGQLKQMIQREVESFRMERRKLLGLEEPAEVGEAEVGPSGRRHDGAAAFGMPNTSPEASTVNGWGPLQAGRRQSVITREGTAAATATASLGGRHAPTSRPAVPQGPSFPDTRSSSLMEADEGGNPPDLTASVSSSSSTVCMAPTQRAGLTAACVGGLGGNIGCAGPHEQASTGYFSASQTSSQFSASGASSASAPTGACGVPQPSHQTPWSGCPGQGGGVLHPSKPPHPIQGPRRQSLPAAVPMPHSASVAGMMPILDGHGRPPHPHPPVFTQTHPLPSIYGRQISAQPHQQPGIYD